MGQLEQKLKSLFDESFPGSETDLDSRPGERIGGFLIWTGFEGIDQIDRQTQVREILRSHLSPSELERITAIFSLTPTENEVMLEESEAV
jgi:hypothetical protein